MTDRLIELIETFSIHIMTMNLISI